MYEPFSWLNERNKRGHQPSTAAAAMTRSQGLSRVTGSAVPLLEDLGIVRSGPVD